MISSPKKAKINWRCRRGMLELDLILGRFMATHFDSLTVEQVITFEHLLNYPDPKLYAWLVGETQPADTEIADLVAFIRFHNRD